MPPMPYNLEKGPYLSMFEHLFNSSPQVLVQCLAYLRDEDHLVTGLLHDFEAPIPAGPYKSTKELAAHINEDWFGLRRDPHQVTGFDNLQEPFDEDHHPTTGFWQYWYGDAQGVVRAALVRAIETALGLGHGDEITPDLEPPRHWRLNLFTICGIRWLEAWVNWRKLGERPHDGVVTVLLLTPSHGRPADPTLLRRLTPGRPGFAPYAVDPEQAAGDQGLWVVGTQRQRHAGGSPALETGWSGLGEVSVPGLGPTYVGDGEIVVVATPEAQGGVLPDGRPYEGGPR